MADSVFSFEHRSLRLFDVVACHDRHLFWYCCISFTLFHSSSWQIHHILYIWKINTHNKTNKNNAKTFWGGKIQTNKPALTKNLNYLNVKIKSETSQMKTNCNETWIILFKLIVTLCPANIPMGAGKINSKKSFKHLSRMTACDRGSIHLSIHSLYRISSRGSSRA